MVVRCELLIEDFRLLVSAVYNVRFTQNTGVQYYKQKINNITSTANDGT